jgi:hypothetical protein
MELKVVDHKPLRKSFYNFLALCTVITAGSFGLYLYGFGLFRYNSWAIRLKDIFLLIVVCLAAVFFFYQQGQRKKLLGITSFEEKISYYEIFYRNRLWWHVFSCVLSGFLLLVTHRIIFLAFCLFDFISMLIAYPSPSIIKKELEDNEIIFSDTEKN